MMIPLLPDNGKLACFAGALFKHANPRGFVSLRAFVEGDKKENALFIESINIGHPQFLAVVSERVRQAAQWPKPAVFCPPVVTLKTSANAKTNNVLEGVALSVDCDQGPASARKALERVLGAPTLVVESGGDWTDPTTGEIEAKAHAHWRLKKPTSSEAEHELLREARALAVKLVGGDASAIALVHPLRWPGSWHRKAEPRMAEIVFQSEREIDLDEALAALRKVVPTQVKANGQAQGAGWAELISGIITGSSYHASDTQLASKMVTAGMSDGAAVNMLRGIYDSSTAPRDERWQSRYDDIPRSVSTAQEKYGTAGPAASEPLCNLVRNDVTEGKRAVTRLAGHLLRRYVDPHVALELLTAFNAARCSPPLAPPEITKIVNWIAGRELARRQAK